MQATHLLQEFLLCIKEVEKLEWRENLLHMQYAELQYEKDSKSGTTTIDSHSPIWNVRRVRDSDTLAHNRHISIWNVRVCDTVLMIGLMCVEIYCY